MATPQAAGSTAKLGLEMAGPVAGSADPYWQRLSDLIVQGSIGTQHAQELKSVFDEANSDKWKGRVPSYILSGMLHSGTLQPHCKVVPYLHCSSFAQSSVGSQRGVGQNGHPYWD